MKETKIDYKCGKIPGGTRGSVIGAGMPDIFAFFNSERQTGKMK